MANLKVVSAGLGHESCTFAPRLTEYSDLRIRRGDGLPKEVAAYFSERDVDLAQTTFCWATPAGVIRREAYTKITDEILDEISKSLPCDGILLSMHGSMEVEGLGHGEAAFLKRLRERVGDKVLISVRLDLHGNIPEEFLKHVNIATALRTAPHRDGVPTLLRAAKLLMRALENDLHPVCEQVRVPLLLPGESVITEVEPAKSLYARLDELDRVPGIMSGSIMVGFAWADTPSAGASIIVSAESDRALAHREASRLADEFWKIREGLVFESESCPVEEAVRRALSSSVRPVFITDSGDNITAGGEGDRLDVLSELVRRRVPKFVFSQICSPELSARCQAAGVGGEVELPFLRDYADEGRTRVAAIVKKPEVEFAVVRCGGAQILLSDRRYPLVQPQWLKEAGIDLSACEIAVFKLGYLMPELRDICPRHIMALSSGPTSLDVTSFDYRHVSRPVFPLDQDFEWSAAGGIVPRTG